MKSRWAALLLLTACASRQEPPPLEMPIVAAAPETAEEQPAAEGYAAEIRRDVEYGVPSFLRYAIHLVQFRNASDTDFGRTMNAAASTLLRELYPEIPGDLPLHDPPKTHPYTKIYEAAAKGEYLSPPASSNDYLEYTLPFLALLEENNPERLLPAVPDLTKAQTINSSSVLAPYFLGLIYERSGNREEAAASYNAAFNISQECYPAALGLGRLYLLDGKPNEAIKLLSDVLTINPDNNSVKRLLALAYYQIRDWSRAEPAVQEILQQSPRESQFLLMRAHILVEKGQFIQAQVPLDLYAASGDVNNKLYLFLRARVQAEGYRNRDAALNYLRSLRRIAPDDENYLVYSARLLMESPRTEDQSEGRDLMDRLLKAPSPSPVILNLAVQEAINRQDWDAALPYSDALLQARRDLQDLFFAYTIQRGLGNNAQALAIARELYERDKNNEEGSIAYISALIDTGRRDEAARMIDTKITAISGGALKSRYYYLRSRVRGDEESAMSDLRSSLFEDPRNLDALIAQFEIYHRRKDERRAVHYLKQALAVAPNNPTLLRYQPEYANALGAAF
jgi:tetratricopeptide (TPR) repeat protein